VRKSFLFPVRDSGRWVAGGVRGVFGTGGGKDNSLVGQGVWEKHQLWPGGQKFGEARKSVPPKGIGAFWTEGVPPGDTKKKNCKNPKGGKREARRWPAFGKQKKHAQCWKERRGVLQPTIRNRPHLKKFFLLESLNLGVSVFLLA